ncbi:MAG TPA: hypothetical protein VMS41_10800 [Gaiellaceae bacterium]|nr:hypothetical protein [Gaiellaceae bacterium]
MITDVNPFIYSHPLAPDDIIDRDDETTQLLTAAVGGHYVRLYAPRKYGKTSLLRRVLREAERSEGMTTVLVDLYGVLSLADVAVRIERAYAAQLKGGLRARIDEFLQRTGLGLSLSALGIGVRLQIDPRTDPLPALHALLDLPLKLEQEGGYRALVVFDEFQDITKLPGIDAIVRSHIQHQGEVASYVFAGSEQGLMKQLFEEKERPLYGQAVPVRLGRLPSSDIAAYIVDRFKQTGRSAGEAVNPLVQTAAGHPQRAMLLAYRLWDVVEPRATATLADWEDALSTTMVELRPEFEAHWQRFTQVEQKSLRAIVEGQGATLRTHVLARLDADKSSVSRALKRLESAGEVEVIDGRTVLVDPLFALWLERLSSGVAGAEE